MEPSSSFYVKNHPKELFFWAFWETMLNRVFLHEGQIKIDAI